ncbi:TIGR04197 family type VII secretion effector [Carnobacterium maltaromaticum]|uniref:TIGR04197 family type VII secretion effector n=2 Tax=Carnobacterium maltaromaticum TaxID=2751 RepID=A0AAW9JUE0_CARML|nr:TIGR04197 family type VII secretion effector [Carnobacterium maltaromaticum]
MNYTVGWNQMEAIQTHTVQADAHAEALKKAIKGAKFPSKAAPTINYSDGAAMVQGQECIQTFSTLLSNLKTSINTDGNHIRQVNQTFVEKDDILKNAIEKAVTLIV